MILIYVEKEVFGKNQKKFCFIVNLTVSGLPLALILKDKHASFWPINFKVIVLKKKFASQKKKRNRLKKN